MAEKFYLVAVHGGAGAHAVSDEADTKRSLRTACKRALTSLREGSKSTHAVAQAITVLEDDPCLNAGLGSNLTIDGRVECDASIMDSRTGVFGSVGAVYGVKNPIAVATAIMEYARTPDPLGRIRPIALVADGAAQFARKQGLQTVHPEALITSRTRAELAKWTARLESLQSVSTKSENPQATGEQKPLTTPVYNVSELHVKQDTVGAIALDSSGGLSAGVSSGGLLLKDSGRIGEAAVYGAGCWAEERNVRGKIISVACSISGTGEYIIRAALATTLAKEIAGSDDDIHNVLERVLAHSFYDVCKRHGEHPPQAGLLMLVRAQDGEDITSRLWCAFTSDSMAIAYASALDPKPRALILRREHPGQHQTHVHTRPPVFITALPLARI